MTEIPPDEVVKKLAATLRDLGVSHSNAVAQGVLNEYTVREEEQHVAYIYGQWVRPGSFADHHCGDPDEPCMLMRRYVLAGKWERAE